MAKGRRDSANDGTATSCNTVGGQGELHPGSGRNSALPNTRSQVKVGYVRQSPAPLPDKEQSPQLYHSTEDTARLGTQWFISYRHQLCSPLLFVTVCAEREVNNTIPTPRTPTKSFDSNSKRLYGMLAAICCYYCRCDSCLILIYWMNGSHWVRVGIDPTQISHLIPAYYSLDGWVWIDYWERLFVEQQHSSAPAQHNTTNSTLTLPAALLVRPSLFTQPLLSTSTDDCISPFGSLAALLQSALS